MSVERLWKFNKVVQIYETHVPIESIKQDIQCCWKVAGVLMRQNGMCWNLYVLDWHIDVLILWSSFEIGTCPYPELVSKVENYVASPK